MTGDLSRAADKWTPGELARELDTPPATRYAWRSKGRLKARALSHNGRKFWLVQADESERARINRS